MGLYKWNPIETVFIPAGIALLAMSEIRGSIFFGIHAHAAHFNVGLISFISELKHTVYRGNLYGGGLSYGYHFAFGKRWGLELTLGIGYAWLDYKEYYCTYCAELRGKKNRHYLGPTRAGVSLIYFIK